MIYKVSQLSEYQIYFKEDTIMNEVMKNILTRRSTRKFTDEQVPKEILKDIVDAALHAPSGMGKQSWSFTVVTNKDVISRLAETMRVALG